MTKIQERLFALQDSGYREFTAPLLPAIARETIIGVRIPAVRTLARELQKEKAAGPFLRELPHRYYEENLLHAAILCLERNFAVLMSELDRFLPFVDNWSVCDSLRPEVLKKHRPELLEHIPGWLASEQPYTVRFGISMLMCHFLDEDFRKDYLDWVGELQSKEYYVNMMIAWYFATALAKQYETSVSYFEEGRLDRWTHNKSIQKAVESYRIPEERKAYLKTLRRKK